MAKKQTSELEGATETEIALINQIEPIIKNAEEFLMKETIQSEEKLKELKDTYEKAIIGDLKDMSGYNFICNGHKEIRRLRIDLQKIRKGISKPANLFNSRLIEKENKWLSVLEPLESSLLDKKTKFEDLQKAEEDRVFTERITKLTSSGFALVGGFYVCGIVHLTPDQIKSMDDENYNFYVDLGSKELQRIESENKRKSDELKELQELKDELKKAREDLAKEREEIALEKKEIEAQKRTLAVTYSEIESTKEVTETESVETIEETKTETKAEEFGDIFEKKPEEETKTEPDDDLTSKVETETKETEDEDEEYVSPLITGFNEFRDRLLVKLRNPDKFTREELIEWVENLVL
jgi:hypothetical protein